MFEAVIHKNICYINVNASQMHADFFFSDDILHSLKKSATYYECYSKHKAQVSIIQHTV